MTLIENWRKLWYRLWSVRLAIAAALLDFGQVVMGLIVGQRSPLWLIMLSGLVTASAGLARVIQQPAARKTAEEAAYWATLTDEEKEAFRARQRKS